MSRLDDLPPDQRATLSLLLRRRKSYADVAAMLDIEERAVHDRAHAALAVLAAPQARELSAEQREEVGDYLLGQRSGAAERLATRTYLESSPQARAWAHALTAELAPLAAGAPFPEIPTGTTPARGAPREETPHPQSPPVTPPRSAPRTRSPGDEDSPKGAASLPPIPPRRQRPDDARPAQRSRLGGALLLAAIVAVIVVAVVLIANSGGGSHSSSSSAAAETETGTSSTGSTGTQTGKAKEDKRITLSSPDSTSKSAGVAEVLSEGNQYAIYLAAQHLPQSKGKGFFYAVWLYNSATSFEAVSRAPEVGSNGSVQGGALLPKDAGKYHTMLLTRETASTPTKPGPVVLTGPFALH